MEKLDRMLNHYRALCLDPMSSYDLKRFLERDMEYRTEIMEYVQDKLSEAYHAGLYADVPDDYLD